MVCSYHKQQRAFHSSCWKQLPLHKPQIRQRDSEKQNGKELET